VEFAKADHTRLFNTLSGAMGKWLVSYNDCEYIRDMYKDYNIMAFTRINNLRQRYADGSEYAELLIANYDFDEAARKNPQQISFLDFE
jgi:DNA adenine methylase